MSYSISLFYPDSNIGIFFNDPRMKLEVMKYECYNIGANVVISLKIIELMSIKNKDDYLNQLLNCKWEAGKWLAKIISSNKLEEMCKKNPRVFLLVKDDKIVSFCTYVHQDEINAPDMYPWIGFVYTYEQYRGNRYFGKLLDYIIALAKEENHKRIYVSTNETGLYEKYGFKYYKNMLDITGNDSRIYRIEI